MHTTDLRKVGASVMLAARPAVTEVLASWRRRHRRPVNRERPRVVDPHPRPNYTLDELLAASDYSAPQPPEELEWVDAPAIGREIL